MSINNKTAMGVFESPNALKFAALTRQGWTEAVTSRINGWGVVTKEPHRISVVKGFDLVHFAPVGADFDNPLQLDPKAKALALEAAQQWCRSNDRAVTLESVLGEIQEEIVRSKRSILALKRDIKAASSLDEKLSITAKLHAAESLQSKQRLHIFAAEDAVQDCVTGASMEPFKPYKEMYPKVAALLNLLVARKLRSADQAGVQPS